MRGLDDYITGKYDPNNPANQTDLPDILGNIMDHITVLPTYDYGVWELPLVEETILELYDEYIKNQAQRQNIVGDPFKNPKIKKFIQENPQAIGAYISTNFQSRFLSKIRETRLTIEFSLKYYIIQGQSKLKLWGGGISYIDMQEVKIKPNEDGSLSQITVKDLNDNGFGVEAITGGCITIEACYHSKHMDSISKMVISNLYIGDWTDEDTEKISPL